MPAARGRDRSLNGLLADLTARLAASGDDRILVAPDDLSSAHLGCIDILARLGLLSPCEAAKTIICDGCDRACLMEVQFVGGSERSSAQPFILCDKRDDIGRVQVGIDNLRRWQISGQQFAEVLSMFLQTDRPPSQRGGSGLWELGSFRHEEESIEVSFGQVGAGPAPLSSLTVTFTDQESPGAGAAIPLCSLLLFRNNRLQINETALKRVLDARFVGSRTACEIKFEHGDVVLINHAVGKRRTVASPNFNSSNDNAFQVLYEYPGRKFSLKELRAAAREPTLADLHKMVENLKFRGALKKLFFRVSSDAICFQRTVSYEDLAALGIDPEDI